MKLHYFVSLCICFLVCLSIIVDAATPTTTPPTHVVEPACDSIVYCNNDILHTVQLSGIFNDSKVLNQFVITLYLKLDINCIYKLISHLWTRH